MCRADVRSILLSLTLGRAHVARAVRHAYTQMELCVVKSAYTQMESPWEENDYQSVFYLGSVLGEFSEWW